MILIKAWAQVLLGCEIAAENWGLDSVYGIVTNYIQWCFIRSLNNIVQVEESFFKPHAEWSRARLAQEHYWKDFFDAVK